MNDQHSMNPDVARKLLQVGEAFRIPGPFFSYEEIKVGNVNHTYKVNYIRDDGTGMAKIKSYLVQRVNTYAFQHPVELMRNIDRVTEHIRTIHPETRSLHFHHTADGNNYLMDEDGFWRLSNYVPSVTFDTCDDLSVVRSAGQAFGDFQMLLSDFGGRVPDNMDDLLRLPGVGRKTANVMLSVIFHQAAMAVDTHVFRVSHRIGLVPPSCTTPLSVERMLTRHFAPEVLHDAHHWLILHGRYVCTAQKPKCLLCGLHDICQGKLV